MTSRCIDGLDESTIIACSKSTFFGLLPSTRSKSLLVGTAWLISSAIFTTYSTTRFLCYESCSVELGKHSDNAPTKVSFLRLPRPLLLTLFRYGGSFLIGILLHNDFGIIKRLKYTLSAIPAFALPALFLFVANLANSISLQRIGISLTYVIKCGIPMITVLLTLLLEGRQTLPSTLSLISLLPIAAGIGAASWNVPDFEPVGFAAAVVSTIAQSALNVSSKRAIKKTGISGAGAQRAMVAVGLVISMMYVTAQYFIAWDAPYVEKRKATDVKLCPPVWLSIAASTAYHVEYNLSFMFMKLVEPVTVGVTDAIRRLLVILAGRVYFGGSPLTRVNISGIVIAVAGAICFVGARG